MNNRILTTILIVLAAFATWVGCSTEAEELILAEELPKSQITIDIEPAGGVIIRSGGQMFDTFDFYLVESGKTNVEVDVFKKFDFDRNKIYIDGLSDGKYDVYILATSGDITEDSAVINEVNSLDECWLEFQSEEFEALQAQYYRESISLEVKDGALTTALPKIRMKHLSGQIIFETEYKSDIAQRTTAAVKVKSNKPIIGSSFSLKGDASNPKKVAEIDITQFDGTILLPPTVNDEAVEWFVTHDCASTFMDDMRSEQIVKSAITSSITKSIKLNLNHKYDEYGLRYFEKDAAKNYGQGNIKFTKIFTCDEDKSYYVFNGPNPRSIKMKTLNTTVFAAAKPEISKCSFFNMRSVGNVSVYAKIDNSPEAYRIMQFDSIPPFFEFENLKFEIGSKLFHTKNGSLHRVEVMENSRMSNVEVVYNGKDEFSNFINAIRVEWTFMCNNHDQFYKAFPSGREAREAMCQMFNMAWIYSQENYWTELHTYLTAALTASGRPSQAKSLIWGDSYEAIDFDYYKKKVLAYPKWTIGFRPHQGVAGYGWHYQFSVDERSYLQASDWIGYHVYTLGHEMGHGWVDNDTSHHVSNLVSGKAWGLDGFLCNYFTKYRTRLPFPTTSSISTIRNTHSVKN